MRIETRYCEIATQVCETVKNIHEKQQIFSAYSSHDLTIVGEIDSAIKTLKNETDHHWVSWQNDMDIEDSIIFCQICKHISESKAILIELSDLNFNVVFEYGYSLGLRKKIHPVVCSNFDYKNVERFLKPLMGIGIGRYGQGKLVEKLLKKKFWEKSREDNIYDFQVTDILSDNRRIEANSLLYIKNIDDSSTSESIEKQISSFSIEVIIDDPNEDTNNIVWYTKQIKKSYAVIIDLGMASRTENFKHYLKCAFISGICVATGRRVLILNSIHAPKPSDIITLIKEYATPKSAGQKVNNFLSEHTNAISVITTFKETLTKNNSTIFDKINLGEHVAINDKYFIDKCFIETPEYKNLSNNGYKLVIGRKGTGKSAAFFYFKSDKPNQNEIIIHQLFDKYNLNELYLLTDSFEGEIEKNKIVNSFWTFVLFLIIAQSINKKIQEDDKNIRSTKDLEINDNFTKYFNSLNFKDPDISVTDYLTEIIDEIRTDRDLSVKKIKGKFYSQVIVKLKKEVTNYLRNAGKTLYLNIDGLDSNLDIHKNKNIISLIIFNLHEVCSNMFGNDYYDYNINLFLRTDLYNAFKERITEKDKITKVIFSWRNEYLMQLINSRLQENGIGHIADLLHETLNIDVLMKKIDKFVFSRPRDYVFLFNHFIQIAQSQKKNKIDNRVFNDVLEYYALHAGESIEAEFLSLPYDIHFGLFLTKIKDALKSEKDRILVKKIIGITEEFEFEYKNLQPFLSFLLQINFFYIQHNDKPIVWHKLSNPDIKIQEILSQVNRRYFYFPPIIQKYIEEFV